MRTIVMILVCCVIAGCHSSTPPTPSATVSRSNERTIENYADDIRTAPDGLAEANALKAFRQYCIDHGYTYRVLPADRSVAAASVRDRPIATTVAVYRAEEHIYTFSFIPRDNRNLALIAKGG